ncbi:vitamin K epoxide reductase family protein [Paraliomyxa miuraensis]|uniref:vitamin K epoxide reductase family protein n=1 Tax=Paraliomyxa miuraensis TaxID=376150 RepID=UPI002259EC4E|nr:vitamin K epoxide reductase family protein [Paraliomyxa miuraensis]MCX4244943.1 thioredoxin domain-containing protein [Paraliomyxa miuraensis]
MSEPDAGPPLPSRTIPVLLSALGLWVSGVLEWIHVKTYLLPSVDSFCTIDQNFDCAEVALSRFSVVLGVPLPLWGAAGFVAMLVAGWFRLRLLWPLSLVAALASVGLLLEELLHVGSVCLMCEAVHVLAVILAIVAWRSHRRHGRPASPRTWARVLSVPATIVLIAMFVIPPYWAPLTWQEHVPHATGVTEQGHPWVGAPEPTLVVEEFVDYACPHCAVATNLTRRRLAKHGDRLRIVRRHQPRMRCNDKNHGCIATRAAHCAGQLGKFWEMDAWLFAHMPGHRDLDVMEGARALGLDEPSFVMCLEDPATYEWADRQAMAARRLKVSATPMYRTDDRTITQPELATLIDAL